MDTPIGWIIKAIQVLLPYLERAYEWGSHLISNFVAGIKAGIGKVHEAMTHVAHTIRSYLPFSPAEQGPLRDLHQVRIVETIAQSLKPAPLAAAMSGVAMAAAAAPGFAPDLGAGGGGGGGATIHYAPQITVNGGGPNTRQDVLDALRQGHSEFADLVDNAIDRKRRDWNRTGF
jgi:hypothetical protein